MRTLFSLLSLVLCTLLLSGCLKVEQRYTLNADGSGKVDVEASVVEWGLDETDKNARQELRDRIRKYIDSAQGIDAWKDVTYSFTDGKIHFKGTAYFSDLMKLKSDDLSLGNLALQSEGSDRILTFDLDSDADVSVSATTNGQPRELSEEEMQYQIDSLKQNWGMMKGMMEMVLREITIRTEVKLPEAPREVIGFTRNGRELMYEFHGAAMLDAMDTMMTNEAFLRQQAQQQSNDMPEQIKSVLFPDGQPRAVFSSGAASQFNYQKELAAARKDHEKIMQELSGKKSTKKKR